MDLPRHSLVHHATFPAPARETNNPLPRGPEAQWCHVPGYIEQQHVDRGTGCPKTSANKQANIHIGVAGVSMLLFAARLHILVSVSTTLSSSVTE